MSVHSSCECCRPSLAFEPLASSYGVILHAINKLLHSCFFFPLANRDECVAPSVWCAPSYLHSCHCQLSLETCRTPFSTALFLYEHTLTLRNVRPRGASPHQLPRSVELIQPACDFLGLGARAFSSPRVDSSNNSAVAS